MEHSNMVIDSISLGLKAGVLIEKGWIILSRMNRVFSELHNLISSHLDLSIIILNKTDDSCISDAFLVYSSLAISFLIFLDFRFIFWNKSETNLEEVEVNYQEFDFVSPGV